MAYPFIPFGLIAIFIVYVIYLLVKNDKQRFRIVIYPGLFFIAVWGLIYFIWLK